MSWNRECMMGQCKLMTSCDCDELRMAWVMTYLLPVIATVGFPRNCELLTMATAWPTIEGQSSRKHQMGSEKGKFLREATSKEIWWSRRVDGKDPVCPFAGTFVMIVGALVTWAIYTQGQFLLWSSFALVRSSQSRGKPSMSVFSKCFINKAFWKKRQLQWLIEAHHIVVKPLLYVQPIADRAAQHLRIISKTFPTNQNSAHEIYD